MNSIEFPPGPWKPNTKEEVEWALFISEVEFNISPSNAIFTYDYARSLCHRNGQYHIEALISCRIATIYLHDLHDTKQALESAEQAVSLNPDHHEGYYCRAEVFCACNEFSKSIKDYMKCYNLSGKTSLQSVCQAIIIAVDQDTTDLLCMEKELKSNECNEIIQFLLKSSLSWQSEHISYLVVKSKMPGSGIASTLSCDLSEISWKFLLQNSFLKKELIQAIMSLQGVIEESDILILIQKDQDEDSEIFRLVLDNCTPALSNEKITSLCQQALNQKKLKYVDMLILQGATPNVSELADIMTDQENIPACMNIMSHVKSAPAVYTMMLLKLLKKGKFSVAEEWALKDSKDSMIDLSAILKSDMIDDEDYRKDYISFIKNILGTKAKSVNEICPIIDTILEQDCIHHAVKIQLLLSILIENHACIQYCAFPKNNSTTLLHIVTKLAIDHYSDDALKLLEVVCEYYPYFLVQDGKILDKDGKSPFHIVMELKCDQNTLTVCEILSKYPIYPNFPDNPGKKSHKKRKRDKRYVFIQDAYNTFHKSRKKVKKSSKAAKSGQATTTHHKQKSESHGISNKAPTLESSSMQQEKNERDKILHGVTEMLEDLSKKPSTHFEPPATYKRQESSSNAPNSLQPINRSDTNSLITELSEDEHSAKPKGSQEHDEEIQDITINDIAKHFEGCSWEIECTEKVKKFFTNMKVPLREKKAAVEKIRTIADGIPLNHSTLCKEIRTDSKYDFKLYEMRFTRAGRIIFEIAVQFSPRLTKPVGEKSREYIFTEVIRLWDVVSDHDKLNRSIDHVVKCIKKSQSRGKEAAIRIPLMRKSQRQSTRGQEKLRLPQYYTCNESKSKIVGLETKYTPAGSIKDDEYNVITFYSFDYPFVKSMLGGDNGRRDFPFKEWHKEHDIISMPEGKVSILLLGRSGTGKTTCCLYRLWNQFNNYWSHPGISEPIIPQKPLLSTPEKNCIGDNADDSQDEPPKHPNEKLEHYHQIFITKNYVLCAQMKKRFYDLAASRDIARDHMPYEEADIPNSLSEVEDLAYPLFLTARQFFLLLDNSLGENDNFFVRDKGGKMKEKLLSSDYDHEDPDTLLDLEESDSEDDLDDDFDEEILPSQSDAVKVKLQERREVTASYFAKVIWPKISKHVTLQDVKIDPLLVWMEIKSFIKGSLDAIKTKEGYLSLQEYEEIGRKMAPNYSQNRQEIYEIFKVYKDYLQHHRKEELHNVFDECDLTHSIYTRLNSLKDLPWSIHSIYIDEVQDFTQAELSIFIRICRDPNDLFLTGDTAQSIMRGISFRFKDLRSLFDRASKQQMTKKSKVQIPKINKLEINFRSHTGVLKLAASVIELMKHFFPNSFDCLPDDEGMFKGPTPKVLNCHNISDLALVLRGNKRESSAIEFGAHQVIIVQSEEAKKKIPDVLKAGIVLTVFESKGLEFDDVLLYDFFKYSQADKDWRVVTAYIEDKPDLISSEEKIFDKPRRLNFDERKQKSLNAELKYLYTAITRAKCNLWIYDSDNDKKIPMFDYWHRRGLIEVVQVSDVANEDQNTLFSTSSKEDWKSQGDYFRKKMLWQPAMKCYQKAECPHLESEAEAYILAQQARSSDLKSHEIQEIYLKAAHAFLKRDKYENDYQSLENAAKCLKNAKKYGESSQLYVSLGQCDKAYKGYRRIKDVEGLARVKSKKGDFDGAMRLLLKHAHIWDALKYAKRYESEGAKISECYRVNFIAHSQINKLLKANKMRNKSFYEEFEAIIKYIPLSERVSYFKEAGMLKEACEILIASDKLNEVCRIYRAQGWYDNGIKLARVNAENKAIFIMLKASAEMAGKLEDVTKEMLEEQMGYNSDTEVKTTLLYGMAIKSHAMLKRVLQYYMKKDNVVGYIETFSIAISNAQYDESSKSYHLFEHDDLLQLALKACSYVRKTDSFLEESDSLEVKQIENFYGFERNLISTTTYSLTSTSYPWTSKLVKTLKKVRDPEGMLQMNRNEIMAAILKQVNNFITEVIIDDKYEVIKAFKEELTKHPLHQDIEKGGYLAESFLQHHSKGLALHYLKMNLLAYQASSYGSCQFDKSTILKCLKNILSPQAASHLFVPTLSIPFDNVRKILHDGALHILKLDDNSFNFNDWLESWRILSVTETGYTEMKNCLKIQAGKYNDGIKRDIPPIYVYNRDTRQYNHVIFFWLKACELIHSGNVLASCTITVHNILRPLARHRPIWHTISLSNLLNIITIQTSTILAMHAMALEYAHQPCSIYVPSVYGNVVQIFCTMNVLGGRKDFNLFEACFMDVARRKNYLLQQFRHKLFDLLKINLLLLIGLLNQDFNPLKFAVEGESSVLNHEAQHCLTLVMILYGNMVLMNCPDPNLRGFRQQIYNSMKHCVPAAHALKKECDIFSRSATITGCFVAVKNLVSASNDSLVQMNAKYDVKLRKLNIELNKSNIMGIPQIRLPTIVLERSFSSRVDIKQPPSNQQGTKSSSELNIATKTERNQVSPVPAVNVNFDIHAFDETTDWEIGAALRGMEDNSTPQQVIEHEVKKESMTDNICKICGTPLVQDLSQYEEGHKEAELVSEHYRTPRHLLNKDLHKKFEEEKATFYDPFQKHLLDLIKSECVPLHDTIPDPDLKKIMDTIDEELQKNDRELDNICLSVEWKEGIKLLNESTERMRSLKRKVVRQIEATKQLEIEKQQQDQKAEEVKDDEEEISSDEEEKIGHTNSNYGQYSKVKQRESKRAKKQRLI